MKKRYIQTISKYIWAENDKQAVLKGMENVRKENRKSECFCSLDSIKRAEFGAIGDEIRDVNIENALNS